jgi:hypothetical protein
LALGFSGHQASEGLASLELPSCAAQDRPTNRSLTEGSRQAGNLVNAVAKAVADRNALGWNINKINSVIQLLQRFGPILGLIGSSFVFSFGSSFLVSIAEGGMNMNLKQISPFKDFFEPFGEFVVVFSMLETQLNNAIQLLTGILPRDLVKMKKCNTVLGRINFFESTLNDKLKDPVALAWAKDITEDLRCANAHRNDILHVPRQQMTAAPRNMSAT